MVGWLLVGLLGLGAAATVIALITYAQVREWFEDHEHLRRQDRENVAITIKTALANGEFEVVQGVYNQRNNTFVESRTLVSGGLDEHLTRLHSRSRVVIHD